MSRSGPWILAVVSSALLASCGGGAEVRSTTTTVSVGQQLIDLKKARDSGSMTQAEYDRAKEQLITRVLNY
jgi:hypothetical protein